jgi:hypothetical protein
VALGDGAIVPGGVIWVVLVGFAAGGGTVPGLGTFNEGYDKLDSFVSGTWDSRWREIWGLRQSG